MSITVLMALASKFTKMDDLLNDTAKAIAEFKENKSPKNESQLKFEMTLLMNKLVLDKKGEDLVGFLNNVKDVQDDMDVLTELKKTKSDIDRLTDETS